MLLPELVELALVLLLLLLPLLIGFASSTNEPCGVELEGPAAAMEAGGARGEELEPPEGSAMLGRSG